MHHETRIVKRAGAARGPRGGRRMAHGDASAHRAGERRPEGDGGREHANDYEYVASLAAGAMRVSIGDDEAQEVRAGDSYVVPANTPYSFEVLERATVVEAVSPAEALRA